MSTTALYLLLILACPLMMLLMHRGGHVGHDHGAHDHAGEPASTDDLRQRRDELDREIAARDGR